MRPPPPKHVESIQDGVVCIRDGGIESIGFGDDAELLQIVRRLIDQGVPFVDQPAGWPPASVVARFHDSGALNAPFRAISWRRPEEWFIREVRPSVR